MQPPPVPTPEAAKAEIRLSPAAFSPALKQALQARLGKRHSAIRGVSMAVAGVVVNLVVWLGS